MAEREDGATEAGVEAKWRKERDCPGEHTYTNGSLTSQHP